MAWYDFITDRAGAVGSYIKHYKFKANRDDIIQNLIISFPAPLETKILLKDGSVIWFDCATDVNHTWPTKVTEYPIESGASVSDHMINGNATFSVTGIFSDSRLRKPDPQGNSTLPDQPSQSDTYRALQKLREDRQSFSLLTALDTYPNVVLKSLGMPRDSGTALKVTMEFEQIRLATSGTTTVRLVGSNGANVKKVEKGTDTKTATDTSAGSKQGTEDVNRTNSAKLIEGKAVTNFVKFVSNTELF